jgi:hypothetical protein
LLDKFQFNDASASIDLGYLLNKSSSNVEENSNYSVQESAISGSTSTKSIQKETPCCNSSNLSAHVINDKATDENYNSLTEISLLPATQFTPIQSVSNVEISVSSSGPLISSATVTTEFPLPVTANISQNAITILDKKANTMNSSCIYENEESLGQLGSCSADIPIADISQSDLKINSQVLASNLIQLPVSQAEPKALIPPVDTVFLPINSKMGSSNFLKRPLKKPKFENGLRKRILRVLEEPSFWDFVSAANLPHLPY